MQEEVLRIQQRIANQILQQGGTPQQPTAMIAPPSSQRTRACSLTQESMFTD